MARIQYKGYEVLQAENNHVMIMKDNKMVLHASCTKKMSKQELKKQVDLYLEICKNSDMLSKK